MNMFGIDLKPLTTEISKFTVTHQQIITLLEENNRLLTQILLQLGGKVPQQLKSLNFTLK